MQKTAAQRRTPMPWYVPPIMLVAAVIAVTILNRPGTARTDKARRELAEAGYTDVELNRGQATSNMTRCEVGQVTNLGYAYPWRNRTHRGLFCLRLDGRPNRIIVD
jgi:hypothetical protein